MKYSSSLLFALLLAHSLMAQTNLPIIKANSKKVSIKDGGYLTKGSWNLSPGIRPDIYTADRTRQTKWVVFYTDIDSIKVKVKPGSRFNFIVLLNGKDSCYTQIASYIPPEIAGKQPVSPIDTIPFTLTAYNAIAVKALINNTDSLTLHFDLSSFDFRFTKDAILKKTSLLSNQPDALSGKASPNFNKLNKVFKIKMGNAVFMNPSTGATSLTAHEMDGRFGWNLFDGKVVELDYDKQILIVQSKLPKNRRGYAKSKLQFIQSFVCAGATLVVEHKKYAGFFVFDNGSSEAMMIDSSWAARVNFPKNLKLIRTSVLRDPRGVKYETRIVMAPQVDINNFQLNNIPAQLLGSKNPVGFEVNYFGNDLLKRFNMILDFKNDCLYLKPNHLFGVRYRENG